MLDCGFCFEMSGPDLRRVFLSAADLVGANLVSWQWRTRCDAVQGSADMAVADLLGRYDASVRTALLHVTQCGIDDADFGPAIRGDLAETIIKPAKDAGSSPNAGCIRDAVTRLSDDDAALVNAGLDDDRTTSDGANDILIEVLTS